MESTNVESQGLLLHDQTRTSSKLKQEASRSPKPFSTGSERPYRDSTFTFLFLAAIFTTFTFGIIASTHTDTLNMDTKLRLSHFNPTTNTCEITQQQTPEDSDPAPDSNSAFVTLAALASLSAFALTIPLSLLLVSLLRRYTRPLLFLFAPFMSLFFLGLGLLWFLNLGLWCLWDSELCAKVDASSNITSALYLSALSALFAYSLWKNWTGSAVENGVEVLRMATGFWKEHVVLLVVNPLLLVAAMVVVNGPIFTFMWSAYNVGEIVPDFDVVNDPLKAGCELATGSACCQEERPGWVYAYITFASFTAFWVLTVSTVLQHLVVSGTVSLWYFAPTGSSGIGNMKRSLGNAYGPSFGTACNLGTLFTTIAIQLASLLKKISDQVLKSKKKVPNILRGCFSQMSQFPECNPKLTSTIASISRLSFWESSKESHHLFQQNSPISTARINFLYLIEETLVGLYQMCVLLQTLAVYGVLELFSNAYFLKKFLITLLCSPIIAIGLAGFTQAVSSVITTVSLCHAIERDDGEISKPEVCHVFMITAAPSLPENETKLQSA